MKDLIGKRVLLRWNQSYSTDINEYRILEASEQSGMIKIRHMMLNYSKWIDPKAYSVIDILDEAPEDKNAKS